MDRTRQTQTPSLARRALIWLSDFEKAMEMRPVDHLELRVAKLERRIDGLTEAAAARQTRASVEA